jgi:four helix bundle protein
MIVNFLFFDLEEKNMKPQELEDRLIDFAVMVIGVVEDLPVSKAGNHIAGQLVRSGTSPAPNYGEARSAESRKDFIHKMKISLRELRETVIWLKIIARKRLAVEALTSGALKECGELIAIFISSTRTADSESLSSKIKN